MPAIYSVSQLIGKTFFTNVDAPVYNVFDLNNSGDQAKPAGILRAGSSFIMDSYLAPTSGYTNDYGITYAPRAYPYLTYYDGNNYMGIMVVAGRFNVPALQAQGALTVQEEIAKAAADAKEGTFSGFLDQFGLGNLGTIVTTFLIAGAVLILAPGAIRLIQSATKKQSNGK